MKTLHIIDNLGLGGAQSVIKGIFDSQINNENIYLFALRQTRIEAKIKHSQYYIYKSSSKYSLTPLKELKRKIDKENIEVLHCHLFRSQLFCYLLKRLFFPEVKLIFHEHGRIFQEQLFYNLFIRHSIKVVDLYIAVSYATARNLKKKTRVPDAKIAVLYNFVNLDCYHKGRIAWNVEEERNKLSIKKDDFVVGFAGRLIERKGWRTFLKAAELTLNSNPNTKFLIAGDGKDKEKLLNLIKDRQLHKNVIYLGYVSNMVWFYSILDCFVMPSNGEAMGLTAIEAQAMGVPVIASDVEALNEIIKDGENGLLFETRNKKDLAEKIKRLIIDTKLRQSLISGGHEAVKEFSLKNYSLKLGGVYNELL